MDDDHLRPAVAPPNQPTEFVRVPCPEPACDTVAIGRTESDARKALYLDHTKERHGKIKSE